MNAVRTYDNIFKILLSGDSGVGKTSLMLRFTTDEFTSSYLCTIGIDFKVKTINLGSKNIKLQIWDTAGQERFRNLTSSYYRGADGIMIIYDITVKESFDNVDKWIKEINEHAGKNCSKLLVGNKTDLIKYRTVQYEQAKAFADGTHIPFIEVSVKDNVNVDTAFITLATEIEKNKQNLPPQQHAPARYEIKPVQNDSQSCC